MIPGCHWSNTNLAYSNRHVKLIGRKGKKKKKRKRKTRQVKKEKKQRRRKEELAVFNKGREDQKKEAELPKVEMFHEAIPCKQTACCKLALLQTVKKQRGARRNISFSKHKTVLFILL